MAINYVISLNKKEFFDLNFADSNKEITLIRDLGVRAFNNDTGIECYVVVKKGKDNIVLFERAVCTKELSDDDLRNSDFKWGVEDFEVVETYEANGLIVATLTITKISPELRMLNVKGLNILQEPISLKDVGLKCVPKVYSKIKERK